MLKSSDIFVIESGEQYKNAVYVYITVVEGTASSTLTIRQVSP